MNDELDDRQQPYRPALRTQNRYSAFENSRQQTQETPKQLPQATDRKDLFTVTIIASTNNGGTMKNHAVPEQQFIIDLIFKPIEPGLKLHPDEVQLLLAHLGEILKELEDEMAPSSPE